jgi:hypothetical protein
MEAAEDRVDTVLDRIGAFLARRLAAPSSGYQPYTPSDPETLLRILQPGDILLVEGDQKISAAIKYLTQSTWSHAAFFAGDLPHLGAEDKSKPKLERRQLIEVNLGEGCVAVPLSKYRTYNTRICRPIGLTPDDRERLVAFMVKRLGTKYDLKHIFDLMRYFLPTPPVPVRFRRRMIAFGSGDPTRAICSTLIAQAFHSIRYPILPTIELVRGQSCATSDYSRQEILHIRHHSLFTPRDFDLSPYFEVIKPTIAYGFDYRRLRWAENDADQAGLEGRL